MGGKGGGGGGGGGYGPGGGAPYGRSTGGGGGGGAGLPPGPGGSSSDADVLGQGTAGSSGSPGTLRSRGSGGVPGLEAGAGGDGADCSSPIAQPGQSTANASGAAGGTNGWGILSRKLLLGSYNYGTICGDIITDGLVLYLDAANPSSYPGSGNIWYDLSANKTSITLYNSPTFSNERGGCFAFDGTTQYGTFPYIPPGIYNNGCNLSNGDYALSAWFSPSTNGSGILISRDTYGGNFDWDIFVSSTGFSIVSHGNNATYAYGATSPIPISPGNWYNVTITYVRDTLYFYINGVQAASYYIPGNYLSNSGSGQPGTIACAGWNAPNTRFNGKIGKLFVFSRGLDSDEVNYLYSACLNNNSLLFGGNIGSPPPPSGNYFQYVNLLLHLNGGNGSTSFIDSSSNTVSVTGVGNPIISTSNSKFDGSSLYLDGSSALRFSSINLTGDYTIEVWVNFDAPAYLDECIFGSTTPNFQIFRINPDNGSSIKNRTLTNASSSISVGASSWNSPNKFFSGYIDELRVSKGVQRYSGKYSSPPFSSLTNDSYTSLLLHMDKSFFDSSSNGYSVVPYGNAQFDISTKYFGNASAAFDGSGDYIISSCSLTSTSDWTVEFWVYPTTTDGRTFIHANSGGNNGIHIYQNGTDLRVDNGLTADYVESNVLTINSWQHVAVCQQGSNLLIFLDGTLLNTRTPQSYPSTITQLQVGRYSTGGFIGDFSGYIDEVRLSSTARYSSTFTPSATAFTNDSYTTVLLHMDIGFYDSSSNLNSITENGNPQISSSPSKIGNASGYFNGSTDYLVIPDSSAFDLSSGSFTIEAWVYPTDLSSPMTIISKDTNGSNYSWSLVLSSDKISTYTNDYTGDYAFESPFQFQTNQWYHISLVGDGSTMSHYVNGFIVGPLYYELFSYANGTIFDGSVGIGTTDALANAQSGVWYHIAQTRKDGIVRDFINGALKQTNSSFTNTVTIDTIGAGYLGSQNYFKGYIDEVRITNGIARYLSSFAAPSAPFTNN